MDQGHEMDKRANVGTERDVQHRTHVHLRTNTHQVFVPMSASRLLSVVSFLRPRPLAVRLTSWYGYGHVVDGIGDDNTDDVCFFTAGGPFFTATEAWCVAHCSVVI